MIMGVMITLNTSAQFTKYIKDNAPTLGLAFIAGACNGQIEVMRHHFPNMVAKHPNINQQFWDPSISWRNKYKGLESANGEKFPLSSTVLVPVTDAYHAIRFVERVCIVGAIAIPICKKQRREKKFIQYAVDFSAHWISYGVGFYIPYGVIYR